MADWSLLPASLVDHVAGYLTAQEQARMSTACKSWREAMTDGLCRRRPAPSIWIIFRDGLFKPIHNGINEFVSFSDGMRCTYFLSMPSENLRIVGSSRGQMMLQDRCKSFHTFHPISRTSVQFPPTDMWIKKAVFVPQRQGCLGAVEKPALAVILQNGPYYWDGELSFACAGDKVWTTLPISANIRFEDIVANEGKIYALGSKSQLVIFDLNGEEPSSSTLEIVDGSSRVRSPDEYSPMKYIGVISDKIFMVRCWSGMVSSPRTVSRFEVSLLKNDAQNRWKWVETKDLASHAVLFDFNGVIVLPVRDHGEVQAGCIYYIYGVNYTVSVMVMNLKSEITSKISPSICSISSLTPLWFLP